MFDTTAADDYAILGAPIGVRVCAFCALWHTNGDATAIDFHIVDADTATARYAAVTAAVGVPSGVRVLTVAAHTADDAETDARCDACCGRLADYGPWWTALFVD